MYHPNMNVQSSNIFESYTVLLPTFISDDISGNRKIFSEKIAFNFRVPHPQTKRGGTIEKLRAKDFTIILSIRIGYFSVFPVASSF